MHFHVSSKLIVSTALFIAAFVIVTLIFVKRPDIVKSRNRAVKAIVIFCIAFVPGVLTATVCAKALTDIYSHIWGEPAGSVLAEDLDDDDEEEDDDDDDAKHRVV